MPDKLIYSGKPEGLYSSFESFYQALHQRIPDLRQDFQKINRKYTKTWFWSRYNKSCLTYLSVNTRGTTEVYVRLFARTDKKIAGIEAKIKEHEVKVLETTT
ncbi:hypothetical protein J4455_00345 [Candidatus Woesearchaeota archaeon]|nr:hypothetical protein [Candidatus Woesearchaeota archaeon]